MRPYLEDAVVAPVELPVVVVEPVDAALQLGVELFAQLFVAGAGVLPSLVAVGTRLAAGLAPPEAQTDRYPREPPRPPGPCAAGGSD